MKTVVILQSNYIPWKGYFDLIHDADIFVFYDEVQYTKNDWRNRNMVGAKGGTFWLSIPISGDSVKLKISEVRLPEVWQEQHFKSLYMTYKSAPYFSQLEPFLEEFYRQRTFTHLSALNQAMTARVCELLGIRTQLVDSSALLPEGDRVQRLVSIVQKLGGDHYLSGPSAKEYLTGNEATFTDAGIRLSYKNYSGYPEYRQRCTPFTHAVTVLDLIANLSIQDAQWHIWGWREGNP